MHLHFPASAGIFFGKKKPAMEIAGMCLPLKPQKEKITLSLNSDTNSFYAPTW
jgi:hypothetical protein